MLIGDIVNPFFPELVKTAQSGLERVGLDMLVFNTDVPGRTRATICVGSAASASTV